MVVIVVIVLFYAATGGELLLLGATLSFSSLYAGWPVDCSCKRVLGTAVLAVCKHQAIKKKTKRRQSQLFLNYVSNLNCRRALSTHTQCDCGPDSNVQQCCECDCHFSPAMRSSACEMPTNFVWLLMPANNYRFIERTVCCKSSMLSDDFSRLHWNEMNGNDILLTSYFLSGIFFFPLRGKS